MTVDPLMTSATRPPALGPPEADDPARAVLSQRVGTFVFPVRSAAGQG